MLKRLLSFARRACDEYDMIEEVDKIAVGVSGGKDSLALLYALAGLRRFYPKKFELCAITIDMGFEGTDFSPIKELCWKDESVLINDGKIGSLTQKLYDNLTGIQWGKVEDSKGWITPVCEG